MKLSWSVAFYLLLTAAVSPVHADEITHDVIPFPAPPAPPAPPTVSQQRMQQVYDEVRTPKKLGVVLTPEPGELLDCPNVFRHANRWYMLFVSIQDKIGYETCLADSDDLVHWRRLGKVLPMGAAGWDQWQADASLALVDPAWGGDCRLQAFDDKYWLSYFGGAKQGYEPDPLAIGLAWTKSPDEAKPWTRLAENPVLSPAQLASRPFEQKTMYKSHVLWDRGESLGYPFVMFFNAKQNGPWVERIGMAVSRDMVHWTRFGAEPIIDNGTGISGDPQVVRLGDLWVMFYFGAGWKPAGAVGQAGAFDTFACSTDLIHWTKWDGPLLLQPSEPWDKTYAHKPWLLKHEGVVYHFYCSVGDGGRAIALATNEK